MLVAQISNMKRFKKQKLLLVLMFMLSITLFFGCGVTQSEISVDGIEISKKNIYLAEGQTAVISAQVYPFNANNQNYTFESTDNSVVTCEDGFITAKKAGDAVIYVYSEEGGYNDSCNVLVVKAKDNLELNNYNNLNMPEKDLKPIYNEEITETSAKAQNNKSELFSKVKKLSTEKIEAEVNDIVDASKNVLIEIKDELEQTMMDLDKEKNILKNMFTESGNTIFDAFNNVHLSIIEDMQNFKASMIGELDTLQQKIDNGEYTVDTKDVNGVTFVVIKNNLNNN